MDYFKKESFNDILEISNNSSIKLIEKELYLHKSGGHLHRLLNEEKERENHA